MVAYQFELIDSIVDIKKLWPPTSLRMLNRNGSMKFMSRIIKAPIVWMELIPGMRHRATITNMKLAMATSI